MKKNKLNKYQEKNKEYIKKRRKQYYQKNKEKIKKSIDIVEIIN